MHAIVTARVPEEIKDQGNAVLREIGATPTQLVNSAYRYVLEHRKLPSSEQPLPAGVRTLDGAGAEKLAARIEATTFEAPAAWKGASFEQLLDEARGERYAHLR